MTDRELLELAAKAAGVPIRWEVDYQCYTTPDGYHGRRWDPLADDGDALRLAVKLAITDLALIVGRLVLEEGAQPDIYSTTRRAIVRAAAEIADTKEPT